jgi:hypothetical protein
MAYLIHKAQPHLHDQFKFLRNLSSNPFNTVIGLVRNVAETEAKVASWKNPNIHIVEGDLNNYESLKVLNHSQYSPAF